MQGTVEIQWGTSYPIGGPDKLWNYGLLKYAMHTWNILEDCGNYKKLTLQWMRIISCQGKKVLEEWRASISNNYHASW